MVKLVREAEQDLAGKDIGWQPQRMHLNPGRAPTAAPRVPGMPGARPIEASPSKHRERRPTPRPIRGRCRTPRQAFSRWHHRSLPIRHIFRRDQGKALHQRGSDREISGGDHSDAVLPGSCVNLRVVRQPRDPTFRSPRSATRNGDQGMRLPCVGLCAVDHDIGGRSQHLFKCCRQGRRTDCRPAS